MSIIGKVSGEILGKAISLGLERLASWLEAEATVKDSLTPRPVDIAIATKSAIAADREGKIASERAKLFWVGERVEVKWPHLERGWAGTVTEEISGNRYMVRDDKTGLRWVSKAEEMTRLPSELRKTSECLHPQARCWHPEQAGPWVKQCPDCGRYVAASTRANVEEVWNRAVVGQIQRNRRLGDYGPSE